MKSVMLVIVACLAVAAAEWRESRDNDLSFKIFGIGFKKTGTTTLAAALQHLNIGPEPSHRQSVAATVALLRPGDGSTRRAAPAVCYY